MLPGLNFARGSRPAWRLALAAALSARLAVAFAVAFAALLGFGHSARAEEGSWPHWRGPLRNGLSPESSLYKDKSWGSKAPAWKRNVGEGASSPVIHGGRLYVLGWRNEQDTLHCLDAASGEALWKQSYPAPRYGRHATGDEFMYSGPSSTPEFDPATGLLYTLSADGDLNCWNTQAAGERAWGLNLYQRYEAPRRARVGRSGLRDYGYTSSPLVLGEALVVEAGAPAGNLIALDKRTGKELWRSKATDAAGHNGGPAPITVEGVPCVAVHHFNGLLVVRADRGREGETVAEWPWQTNFANNIATPTVHEDCVLLTSSYNHHKVARLRISLAGAALVWEAEAASKVCSSVVHAGHVYFAWQGVHCLDYESGRLLWKGPPTGDPGSCLVASDGRLISWTANGDLRLIETAPRAQDKYLPLAAREGLLKAAAWPHVALSGGRVYCKDREGNLVCLEL